MRTAWMAGLALVVFGASPTSADEWSRRYPVEGRPELRVKADDASVRVEANSASQIEVQVTTEGWPIGEGGVSVIESQSGNRVEIEVRRPKGHNGFSMRRRSIAVVVSVPTPADLDVRTGDGGITADGLEGEIHLQTGDGSIEATGLAGQLEANTGDGHMDVRGRFDELDLRSGDGGIEAVAEQGSRVQTAWSLRSGDGSITLRLPEDLGAELDAHTGDGRIDVDRPFTVSGRLSESAVRGTLGPGGPPLRIHTGDGSIRIVGL